jgi:hypothetical protein
MEETMPKPFDPTKPVQNIDGRPARIICTDRQGGDRPILALVQNVSDSKSEMVFTFWEDGTTNLDTVRLVNTPEIRYEYQNIYKSPINSAKRYMSEDLARSMAGGIPNLGMLKYTFEDGDLIGVELMKGEEP